MSGVRKPALVFSWEMFGPYHMDRLEAVGRRLGDRFDVVGLEIGSKSHTYAWDSTGQGRHFRKITLFPGRSKDQVAWPVIYAALARACLGLRPHAAFLCNYEDPDVFALAVTLRAMGRRLVAMQASKFDDKPRFLTRELGKALFYAPYQAGLAGSERTRDYLRLLGIPGERIFLGYDTLSLDRIRALAGTPPAPDGTPWTGRHFTIIARFVPKKNLLRAVEAYALYRDLAGAGARPLHLCGSGPLEAELRAAVERHGLAGHVIFRGFLQEKGIAETLGTTLALLLPSTEEQFGLVVNEALAMGLPVVLSDVCGARDLLVRQGVNGHVVEPDNPEGLARAMLALSGDEAEWQRMSLAGRAFQPVADAGHFAEAVEKALASLNALPESAPLPTSLPAARRSEG
ncbi:glycosyltransferase family 4 protein [Azospirillum sp. TSO22-1]|uniref:glycosyltransferase family 4 protein n=1 Tax=Azospirillum sp. TSO22-1 TaxID=716789 RepID=UPI000D604811|nr:glycosyltransferase family 4 protein [Azospirillum sp. TSO22-1]PWC43548.1 glycosyl transferase family 1 [Azospirillum sp. TSO22-1]